MKKVTVVGSLLKKIYRHYNTELLNSLQDKGFTDLRPSFLEVLLAICEQDRQTIKHIGDSCGLKKQTMTSHLNELESRGYIKREQSADDKRSQLIVLTEYGEKFKMNLNESASKIEENYIAMLGEVELDRILVMLTNFHKKVSSDSSQQTLGF